MTKTTVQNGSDEMAQETKSLIIHGLLMCGNIRTSRRGYSRRRDPKTTTFAEHFWSRVDRKSDAECWPWLAAKQGDRYGLCCNPAHLYLGTQAQNVLDAIDRGRHVFPNWRRRNQLERRSA